MPKINIRTQLTAATALMVLLTVGLISILSNQFIHRQFQKYKLTQQTKNLEQIADTLSEQYHADRWNIDVIHGISMNALMNGYILRVSDMAGTTIWDANLCDMAACGQVMKDISNQMLQQYPNMDGGFAEQLLPIVSSGAQIGVLTVSHYEPYFYNDTDLLFLDELNKVLVIIGLFSLVLSVFIGFMIAKQLSKPIRKTSEVAKQISAGEYTARIEGATSTKEVSELMVSVNTLASVLQKQERLRKQLTADVAHELRTPLTTLQTHLEAMADGVWEPTSQRLQSCQDEVTRVSNIVIDLENLSKADCDNLHLQKKTLSLNALVREALSSYALEIEKKNMHLSIEGEEIKILADTNRLDQAIKNLISNAIKYTQENGCIHISLSQTNKTATLTVKDDGVGISESDLPHIFERFFRADKSRNRATGGSGIGLAIVKSIVQAHGGKVWAVSALGRGSEFTLELPMAGE